MLQVLRALEKAGIETDGVKDESKMAAFVAAARKEG